MEADGRMKYLPEKRLHRDSDASDGSNHLMVTGLYDDDAQERKSSISFDKIKQISLTYSLQGSEDEPDRDLPLEQLANDAGTRRESSGSYCLSPAEGEPSGESRKVSVIDLKNSALAEKYKLNHSKQIECVINDGFTGPMGGAPDDDKIDGQIGGDILYSNSRYPDTNPFAHDESNYEFSGDQKASEDMNYGRPVPKVTNSTSGGESNWIYYEDRYGNNMAAAAADRAQNRVNRVVLARPPQTNNQSVADGQRSELIGRNVNMLETMVAPGGAERIGAYSPRMRQSPQAREADDLNRSRGRRLQQHQQQQQQQQQQHQERLSRGNGSPAASRGVRNADGRILQGSLSAGGPHLQTEGHYREPRSTTSSNRSPGSDSGTSVGLRLKRHNNSISLVVFNETDSNIMISDDPESLSDESLDFDSATTTTTRNHTHNHDMAMRTIRDRGGGPIDYYSENDLMSDLVNGAESGDQHRIHHSHHHHHHRDHRYHHDSSNAVRDENIVVGGASIVGPGVTRQIPAAVTRSSNQTIQRNQHGDRNLSSEKFDSRYKSSKLKQFQPDETDTVVNQSARDFSNYGPFVGANQQQQQLDSSYQQPLLNQDLPNSNNNFVHNQEGYRAQLLSSNQSTEPPRPHRMVSDKSSTAVIGYTKDLNGSNARTKNNIHGGLSLENSNHSLVRDEKTREANPNDCLYMVDAFEQTHSRKPTPVPVDNYGAPNNHADTKSDNNSLQYMDGSSRSVYVANNVAIGGDCGQGIKAAMGKGRQVLDQNITFQDNSFVSQRLAQKQKTSMVPYATDDFVNSIYASPMRRPLPRRTNDYLDDNRSRIDIVISSPKRYNRFNKRQLSSQAFSQNTSPAINNNIGHRHKQDSDLFLEQQRQYRASSGRRSGELQRTNRIHMDHYQQSPPSSIGSHSGWSNSGSYAKDLDKTFLIDSRSSGQNEGFSEDSLTSLKRTQRNQKAQQQQQQQHLANTERYTIDTLDSNSYAKDSITYISSPTKMDSTRSPADVAQVSQPETEQNATSNKIKVLENEKNVEQTTVDSSNAISANLNNNQPIKSATDDSNKVEKSPQSTTTPMVPMNIGCPFISPR